MPTAEILSIPSEVIEYTLITFCPLSAVASFSQTCRLANTLVHESPDQYLWRQLFLLHFDDPRKSFHGAKIQHVNWKAELQRRIKAKAAVFNLDEGSFDQAIPALATILHEAPPFSKGHASRNITWLSRIFCESQILECPSTPPLARLRCCLTLLTSTTTFTTFRYLIFQRNNARSMVYDLRNYRPENNWGPYLDGGKEVNWVHMEAIVNVICGNLSELPPRIRRRPPGGLEATRPYSAPCTLERDPRDWAGVVGTWRRYVCFMDYRDLFAFNYSTPSGALDSSLFCHPTFQEATRLIEVKFRLIDPADMHVKALGTLPTDDAVDSPRLVPGMEGNIDLSKYPPSYYVGVTRGAHGNEATVEGVVRMCPDGSVRWKFTTVYEGHTEWWYVDGPLILVRFQTVKKLISSEGVQVGNVASAAGVAGIWTGVNHSPGDPVGPFWMWKVEEDHPLDLIDYN